jgi:integrase
MAAKLPRARVGGAESVRSFADRWLVLNPRQKESTNIAYREQVAPFVRRYGALALREVDVQLAVEWLSEMRWTHNGIRAMSSDARRLNLVESNPFAGLRLRGARGRRDLAVLSVDQVNELASCATEVWSGEVGLGVRALVLLAAFSGPRPAELYGLRWTDLDFRSDEVHVESQHSPQTRRFELPKNGRSRVIVLTPPARAGLARAAASGGL